MTQFEGTTEERQKQNPVSADVLHRTSPKFPSILNFWKDDTDSSSVSPQEDHHDHDDDHRRLVTLLWIEICRDGGISYIHSLANYSTSRTQIQQLLKNCSNKEKYGTRSSSCGGVTAFMEMYPHIFQITSSSTHGNMGKQQQHNTHSTDDGAKCHDYSLPVVRIPWKYYYYDDNENEDNEEVHVRMRENVAQALTNRVIYLVRQRSCKLKRRRREQLKEQEGQQQCSSYPAAQLTWLANKAVNEIHQYVRLLELEKRPKGYAVKAPQWWKQTLPLFCSFLQNQPHHFQVVVHDSNDDKSRSKNQGVARTTPTIGAATRIDQQPLKEPKALSNECMANVTVDLVHHDGDGMDPSQCESLSLRPSLPSTLESATTTMNSHNKNRLLLYKQNIVTPIATHIKSILAGGPKARHEDDKTSSFSPHLVGGMDLGRLQENHKLRMLLSGRDLYQLIQDHPTEFEGITLVESATEELNNAVTDSNGSIPKRRNDNYRIHYHHDKSLETKETNHDATSQLYNANNNTSMTKKSGRLLVKDNVGLYSITASQQATAMTNGLARALVDLTRATSSTSSQLLPSSSSSSSSSSRSFHQTHNKEEAFIILEHSICIDFTAGVGGNTVSFHRKFPRVIAVEIDAERAQLCHQNVMEKYGRDCCGFTGHCTKDNHSIPGGASNPKRGGNPDCHDPKDGNTTAHKTSGGVQLVCTSALDILPQLAMQFRPPPATTTVDDNEQQQQQQYNGTGMDNCGSTLSTSPNHKKVATESGIQPNVYKKGGDVDHDVKYDSPPIAAFLDPPWGGLDYRQPRPNTTNDDQHDDDNDNWDKRLGLDQLPLSQVVALISRHLKPFVLGMKLPLSFDIHSWMTHQLAAAVAAAPPKEDHHHHNSRKNENKDGTFRIVSIQKMKRQLFLLLEIQ